MKSNLFLFLSLLILNQPLWACDESLQRYSFECKIQDEYRKLENEFSKFNVDIETVTLRRSLRFVSRNRWDNNKSSFFYSPYLAYDPAPDVWLKWEDGASFTKKIATEIDELKISDIKDLHKETMSEGIISYLAFFKGSRPGKMRNRSYEISPGFTVNCESKELDQKTLDRLMNYDLKDRDGEKLVRIISHSRCENDPHYYSALIAYTKSKKVPYEMQQWVLDFNFEIGQYRNGDKKEYSPYDMIADAQRKYVSIHPFGDGNGRTSRFMQDFATYKLGLPVIPAGELQSDVFADPLEYRKLTKDAVSKMITELSSCLTEYHLGLDFVSDECKVITPLTKKDVKSLKAIQKELKMNSLPMSQTDLRRVFH